ncbi:MAG: alpha/beta fold hydrolase [Chloroflexi bacterium]|nr:alpha/beta fold hydrolase [Chloroflexota bacterium]MCI0786941.1 alpha/beta fold hydrolase [Chloroflexota bacterium]MCI0794127.1 alpha/beta fold hydrolase [Chloroflexota bacterium]MCI0798931.1 alpha/beta fold hydrolase [Chloroflexota bacterium]MCI0824005.1 alpha/beta fold hydrolase [Chloroflexota bacterium]
MIVDLMSTQTSDGIRLDGAFFAPDSSVQRQGPLDAVLLVHGSSTNFYAPATRFMAEDLRKQGIAGLALNTTAHDTVWVDTASGRFYGIAFEILDRSRLDLRAGIDYLWELGYRRIALLGHSMGAVRVAYYAATEDDGRVAAVIPVSPVRLSYSYYMDSEDAEEFKSIVQQAGQLEAKGKAQELMSVKFPITQMFGAAAYLDKHGPAERYNLVTLAPKIKVPLFAVAGSLETHTRLRDMAHDLAVAAVNSPQADYIVIEGGNHSLNNRREEAASVVLNWLGSLTPQPVGR